MPLATTIIPNYFNFARAGGVGTYWGPIVMYAAGATPFATVLMTNFFRGIPDELVESAVIDGASYWQVFTSDPGAACESGADDRRRAEFLGTWNDLLVGLLFLPDPEMRTISVNVAALQGVRTTNIEMILTSSLLSAIPPIGVSFRAVREVSCCRHNRGDQRIGMMAEREQTRQGDDDRSRRAPTPNALRSGEWFAREGKYGFIPRSWMKSQGFGPELFDGRPVIGICNTWSSSTNCNRHLRELAEHVKRGVLMAGGFPLEFPVTSLGEPLMRPTTMMFRNLVSMDVEETDPRQPDRWRRAARRLRQDHAGAADGRGELRRTGDPRLRRVRC